MRSVLMNMESNGKFAKADFFRSQRVWIVVNCIMVKFREQKLREEEKWRYFHSLEQENMQN